MKKFPVDKKYSTISVYAVIVIAIALLFGKAIDNVSAIQASVTGAFGVVLRVLAPFIYGLLFAYLLNSAVKAIEGKLLKRIKYLSDRPKITRPLAVMASLVIVIGCIAWIITYLVPEIVASIQRIIEAAQIRLAQLDTNRIYINENGLLDTILETFNQTFSTNYTVEYVMQVALAPVLKVVAGIPDFASKIYSGTVVVAGVALNTVLGIVIAFYMLCEKDTYSALLTKIIHIIFKKPSADKIIGFAKNANTVFEKFFIGKTIDSTIVGIIFFIICIVLKVKYAVLLSIIIGVTNMIPYFGPFIGAVPVVLIILLNDPVMAMWMILIIFVLQQFDGIFLGPKILGESTGVKPIGVIFAILVGGATFGVLGMFFGVPLFAVASSALNAVINRKYNELKNKKEGDNNIEIS